jgi:hypothetical protein
VTGFWLIFDVLVLEGFETGAAATGEMGLGRKAPPLPA